MMKTYLATPILHDLVSEHLPDKGFRWTMGGRSWLQSVLTSGKTLGDDRLRAMMQRFQDYLDGIEGVEKSKLGGHIFESLPEVESIDDTAFIYMTDETLDYWRVGSIQLSTVARYRTIENLKARDIREGVGSLYILNDAETEFVFVAGEGGISSYVLCTTRSFDTVQHKAMQKKFGQHLIKITRLREFSEKLKLAVGAYSFEMRDVVYTDYKCFKFKHPVVALVRGDYEAGKLMSPAAFTELMPLVNIPTVFSKPLFYASERERRLSFNMPKNCIQPTIVVVDPDLWSHVEVIE